MANSTKSVSTYTIKKGTFDLNEYNKSYSNSPLYSLVGDMIKEKVKENSVPSIIAQVFEYFYDRSDFRGAGDVETYYIVGYKDEYNMAEYKKPWLAKFIYNRLIGAFNEYLSETLYNVDDEGYQKYVDAINIVYKTNSNFGKTTKLVDKLWDVYCDDNTLETNWDVRDKITEGFQQSNHYKEFVSGMCELITQKFDIRKEVATHTLLEMVLGNKVNQRDEQFGEDFLSKLKYYNELQSEIAELNNEINNL